MASGPSPSANCGAGVCPVRDSSACGPRNDSPGASLHSVRNATKFREVTERNDSRCGSRNAAKGSGGASLASFAAREVSRSNRGRRRAPREAEGSEGPGSRSRPVCRAAGRWRSQVPSAVKPTDWSGRPGSNWRPPAPKAGTLPLRYAPRARIIALEFLSAEYRSQARRRGWSAERRRRSEGCEQAKATCYRT